MSRYSTRKEKILDCGIASGLFLRQLYYTGYDQIYGLDINDYRTMTWPGELKLKKFFKKDASKDKIPVENDFFDIVTAWEFIEHLENPHHFCREVARVLKPTIGFFFIAMPNPISLKGRIKFMVRGDLHRFQEENDHITPLLPAIFKKTFLKYFNLIETIYIKGSKKTNKWFGNNVVYVLQKKGIPLARKHGVCVD